MNATQIEFDPDLIRRLDRAGPRYTSYPTADRFVEAFDERSYLEWAARRNIGGVQHPLSIYVHLPFCRDVCFYCACNKIVTRNAGKAAQYIDYLNREIDRQSAIFRDDPRVVQMHWGGGTPTYHDMETLSAVHARLAGQFDLARDGEYSIEVDPRTVGADTLHALRALGFNRVSFGVQDFDPAVQAAVHRVQSREQTLAAVDAARCTGFQSINVDLIYGLPKQTTGSFARTVAQVVAVRPDRIALYNYAHLPRVFKPQRRIREEDLPAPAMKLRLLELAVRQFKEAGYGYIGMDHFALPGDALAVAQRNGQLHRNFQGYSTIPETDLVGLGVSAIGAVGPTYSQNYRELEDYYAALDAGSLPVMRGIELSADDLLRRSVIQALMCQFVVSKEAIGVAHLVEFDRYFASELRELRVLEDLGLITTSGDWLGVTPKGRFLIRNICMVFDRYLPRGGDGLRHSRVV